MPRDQVFISYSHNDTKWLKDLEIHLKPYLREGSIISWSDEQITPGSKWFSEIKSALTKTKVAVLLVTPDFIASDFIHEHELGPLLKEAGQGGTKILWVPVYHSAYKKTALKNYQAIIDPGKPLGGMTKAKRGQDWVTICEEIEKAVNTAPSSAMRIFFAASTEKQELMEEIASWLEDLGAQVILWSDATAFPPGQFTLARLVEIARHEVSAAVLVFGADDKVWYRESERLQLRDNVLLEFWLFAAHLGFERTLIVQEGRSALPSDLGGLQVVPAARRLITAWYARINSSVSIFPHDEPNSLGDIRFYRLPRDSSDGDMLNDLKVARRATFLGVSHQHLADYLAKVVQDHPDTLPLEEVNVCFAAPDDGQLFEGADFLGNVRRSIYRVASTLMDPASRSKLVRFTALRFYQSTRHRTFGGCSLVASEAGEEIFYVNHYLPTVHSKTEDLLTLRFTANAQRDPVGRDILDAYRSAFEVFLNTAQRCGTFTPSLWDLSTEKWHLFASQCRAHQASMSHLISVAGIKKGELVLDIGAATGDTSRLLAQAGAKLTVLDASPNMIHTARELLGDTVRYAMCSVGSFEDDERIELDGTYDVIVCHLALPALAADGPALRRMAVWCSRHLSENGRFALSCHNTAVRTAASTFDLASDPLREAFGKIAAEVGLDRFYRQRRAPILTSAEIQRAFRAAGFISDRPITMRWPMDMRERMMMWSAPAVLDRLFEVRSLDPGAIRSLLERTAAELGTRHTPDTVVTFWVFHKQNP